MKVIISPDSFKGTLTALEAATAIEAGIRAFNADIDTVKIPIADGGEGTMEALVLATNGHYVAACVQDPLGRQIVARYGVLGDGTTCVIEMAAASGLTLLHTHERNPKIASTYGTGQLLKHALQQGFSDFIICIGGSATNDGGIGMLRALGLRLVDKYGRDVEPSIDGIFDVATLNFTQWLPELSHIHVRIACDVNNPLIGQTGATAIFGPQKGVQPHEIAHFDNALTHWANIVEQQLQIRLHDYAGAGAAGGMGGALIAFLNGRFHQGIDLVLDVIDYERQLDGANYIITGEGQSDQQTLHGKAPIGIRNVAERYNIPTILLSGHIVSSAQQQLALHFAQLISVVSEEVTAEQAMSQAAHYLQQRAFQTLPYILT